jgi:3-demethoxyubiquinol 3-hydroxylase
MRNLSAFDRFLGASAHFPAALGALKGPRVAERVSAKPLVSEACEVPAVAVTAVASGPEREATFAALLRQPALPDESGLNAADRGQSASLMRVNHVGEVCAQALYEAQALVTKDDVLRAQLLQAAQDERRHLQWVQGRLDELGAKPSLLNPLWFGGAFGLGLLAGLAGDKISLGFVAETEKQVEAHLAGHLTRLPVADVVSREIVEKMRAEEAMHGQWALQAGGVTLIWPVRLAMRFSAKIMTTVAHYI